MSTGHVADDVESRLRARVRATVLDLAPRAVAQASGDAHLVDHLDFDSLGLLELATVIEQEFHTPPIGEADVVDVNTIGDVERLVVRLLERERDPID